MISNLLNALSQVDHVTDKSSFYLQLPVIIDKNKSVLQSNKRMKIHFAMVDNNGNIDGKNDESAPPFI